MKILASIFMTTSIFLGMVITTTTGAHAQFDEVLQQACSENSDSVACQEIEAGSGSENPVTTTTEKVVNILSAVIATMAVVVIIVAGITMTLSQGDSGKIKSSRDAIIYAAVGIVVVALSRSIIIFVINRTR